MDRVIEIGPNGMVNPDADTQCGAINANILLPEPIHIGGCKGCQRIIHEMLMLRYQRFLDAEKQAKKIEERKAKEAQIPGPWLNNER